MKMRKLLRSQEGAAVIEMAFALPAFIVLIWMIVQLGLVFRAMSGIQHSLGEGARAATLWPIPDLDDIETRMDNAVYGIGPGDFETIVDEPVDDPDTEEVDESKLDGSAYLDLTVNYTQETDLILLPGPTISVSRSKRVWVSESD